MADEPTPSSCDVFERETSIEFDIVELHSYPLNLAFSGLITV